MTSQSYAARSLVVLLTSLSAACSGGWCASGRPTPSGASVAVDSHPLAPAAAAPSAPSLSVADTVAAMSHEERRNAYEVEVGELRARLERLETYLHSFPSSLTDVDALAGELAAPEAAFEFVRDKIALEPYPGVMKGARGTLVTRGGNAVDRALLLAAILKRNHVSARIAHARLSEDQGRQLLQWIQSAPAATERMLRSLQALDIPSSTRPGQEGLSEALNRRAESAARAVEEAVQGSRPFLEASLTAAGVAGPADTGRQTLDSLLDHYWIQAVVGGRTVDLDPAIVGGRVGQHFADASETFNPDDLPDDLFQHIRFRVVADFLATDGVHTPLTSYCRSSRPSTSSGRTSGWLLRRRPPRRRRALVKRS